jgi:hypothetical protein
LYKKEKLLVTIFIIPHNFQQHQSHKNQPMAKTAATIKNKVKKTKNDKKSETRLQEKFLAINQDKEKKAKSDKKKQARWQKKQTPLPRSSKQKQPDASAT